MAIINYSYLNSTTTYSYLNVWSSHKLKKKKHMFSKHESKCQSAIFQDFGAVLFAKIRENCSQAERQH